MPHLLKTLLLPIMFLSVFAPRLSLAEGPPAVKEPEYLKSLDYPELQVTPRASERLEMEAKAERTNRWWVHWPFQASAFATLFTGMVANNKYKTTLSVAERSDADFTASLAMGVGAAWLMATVVTGVIAPYSAGWEKVSGISKGDRRSALQRERLAEEALEWPADFFRKIKYFSVITNFGVSVALMRYLNNSGVMYAAGSGLLAFLPFIFQDRYIEVYDKQMEYKRKIYVPIVSTNWVPQAEGSKDGVTTLTATWVF